MALPTLQDFKNRLRITTTAENAALVAMLGAATQLAKAYLDRPLEAVERTYVVEDQRAAALSVSRLSRDPIAAAFIRVPDAPVDIAQPITITDRNGVDVDSTSFRVDRDTGVVRGGGFAGFPYTIIATTGLATRADYAEIVEPMIGQAILDIASDLYQRRNPAATDENDGAGGYVRYGRVEETIPARAIAYLAPWRRPQV
ncbi:MAG TPA: phage head-tail connector protein [Gemmatimonadaceae bacterium]|nr:phage head-tail connector protein [Gemmatimonadaceae bacterium]